MPASSRFNPGLGFRSVATICTPRMRCSCAPFQSRSGFSVRRDVLSVSVISEVLHVSIPVWVFGPSRLDEERHNCQPAAVSIPVWVFGPSRHSSITEVTLYVSKFQSRSGFSVRRDFLQRLNKLVVRIVSIPVWVFGPSRRSPAGLSAHTF